MSDSIKVAIKVRPLIKREKDENLPIQWSVQGNTIVSTDTELKKRGDGGFCFDHIFDMNATNSDVFDSIVRPIVDAAVNGFNGTVFAYGQTSSGKTYTMMGTLDEPGIVPLAIEHMFEAITNTAGREFLLRVSYLEIYKEKINDLLNKTSTDLKLKEDTSGQVCVQCKEEITNSPENMLSIMKKGDKNRRTGETNMNERSSRSHTIFRITIESREVAGDSDGAIQVSQLNLVDLAGSERARQTGATGERFKEGLHINLSLSTLGLVIMQLSECQEGQKYVNFRDSKLTRLLQNSLGGNAMTTIICAVTPAAVDETQCTLSFACRAKSVKNKPQVNEVMSDATLLKRYAKQISKLQTELEIIKQENRVAEVEEMESKLQEKERLNQLLEERIELLKTRIVSGDTTIGDDSFKIKAKRRQTWGGPGMVNHLPGFQTTPILATTKEVSREKSCRKSIIQSVNLMNQTFQTAFTDFELELFKSECDRVNGSDSEDEPFITKRKHRVTFRDEVFESTDKIITTPEKLNRNMATQTISCQASPSTPKHVLRRCINDLTKEFEEMREFTTLEKQLLSQDNVKKLEETESERPGLDYALEVKKRLGSLNLAEETNAGRVIAELCSKLGELEKQNILEKETSRKATKQFSELEKQLKNITSERDEFEYMSGELRTELKKKTAELELKNMSEESVKEVELRKIFELERKLKNVTQENVGLRAESTKKIAEFQKEAENIVSERKEFELIRRELCAQLNMKTLELQNLRNDPEIANADMIAHLRQLEKRTEETISEKTALEQTIVDLRAELSRVTLDAESRISSERTAHEETLGKVSRLEKQVEDLESKGNELERINVDLNARLDQNILNFESKIEAEQITRQEAVKRNLELEEQLKNIIVENQQLEANNAELNKTVSKFESATKLKSVARQETVEQLSVLQKEIENTTFEENELKGTMKLQTSELESGAALHQNAVEKASELEKHVADLVSTKTKMEEIISNQQNEHQNALKRISDLEQQIECIKTERNEFEQINAKLQAELSHEKSELESRTTVEQIECQNAKEKASNLEIRVADLASKKTEMEEIISNQQNEHQNALKRISDLEQLVECIKTERNEFEQINTNLQAELSHQKFELESRTTVEQIEYQNAKEKASNLEIRVADLVTAKTKMEEIITTQRNEHQNALKRISELEQQIECVKTERNEFEQINAKLQAELTHKMSELDSRTILEQTEYQNAKEKASNLEIRVADLASKKTEMEEIITAHRNEHQNALKRISELEQQIECIKTERNEFEQINAKLQAELSHEMSELESKTTLEQIECQNAKEKASNLEIRVADLASKKTEMEEIIRNQQNEHQNALRRISDLEQQVECIKIEKNEFEQISAKLQAELSHEMSELESKTTLEQIECQNAKEKASNLEIRVADLASKKTEMEKIIRNQQNEHQNALRRISDLEQQVECIKTEKNNVEQINAKLQAELNHKMSELESRATLEQTEYTNAKEKASELEKRVAELLAANNEMEEIVRKQRNEHQNSLERISDLEQQIQCANTERNEFEQMNAKLQAEFESRTTLEQTEYQNAKEESSNLEMRVAALVSTKTKMEEIITTQQNEHQNALKRISDLTQQIECIKTEKNEFEGMIAKLQAELSHKITELESRTTLEQNMKEMASNLEMRVADLVSTKTEMEEIITTQQNEHQNALKRISDLKQQIECIKTEKNEFEQMNVKLQAELSHKMIELESRTTLEQNMKEMASNLEMRVADLVSTKTEMEEIITTQQNEHQNALKRISDLTQQIECVKTEKNEFEQMNVKLQAELSHKMTELESRTTLELNMKEMASNLEMRVADLVSTKTEMEEIITTQQNEHQNALKRISDLTQQIECVKTEKNEFEQMNVKLQAELSHKMTELESRTTLELNMKEMASNLEMRVADLVSTKTEMEEIITTQQNEHQNALKRISDLTQQIECVKTEKNEFERMNAKLQAEWSHRTTELESRTTVEQTDLNAVANAETDGQEVVKRISDLGKQIERSTAEGKDRDRVNVEPRAEQVQKSSDLESRTLDQSREDRLDNQSFLSQSRQLNDSTFDTSALMLNSQLEESLYLKSRELDEIKCDVQSLKQDVENLQKTIYLLTTENMEMTGKLTAERDNAKQVEANLQKTIDELYGRISDVTSQKITLESNLAALNDQLESMRSRGALLETVNNEEEPFASYKHKIDVLTAENIELSTSIAEKNKELESIKESKSLLFDHECMYKEQAVALAEKNESLRAENDELSTDLIDKIEENDEMKEQCEMLKKKIEDSLTKNEASTEGNTNNLQSQNSMLKAEIIELKTKLTTLSKENAKYSNDLLQTIEDLDSSRNEKFGLRVENPETLTLADKVATLQEKVNQLTHLNQKLSDLKLTSCNQCAHLKNLNESRRAMKLEAKTLNQKLEDLQRKFDRKCEDIEILKNKMNQESNTSVRELSPNVSFVDEMNVSFVEERVRTLHDELQTLKADHDKLTVLYEDKCNELVQLRNDASMEESSRPDSSPRQRSEKNSGRLVQIQSHIDQLKTDIDEIRKNSTNFAATLNQFRTEKASLLKEIESLRARNEELEQTLCTKENIMAEKIQVLENELTNSSKELERLSDRERTLESQKLTLQMELEELRIERDNKIESSKQRINDIERLNEELKDIKLCMMKELRSLKCTVNTAELSERSVNEIFLILIQTLVSKEQEMVKMMRGTYEKEKQVLQEEIQQSADREKRANVWAKELETEIEKLQVDMTERERSQKECENKISRKEHLVRETARENEVLREKASTLETDLHNLQTELEKLHKVDGKQEEAICVAQKREKEVQQMFKGKELELQSKLEAETEMHEKRINELARTVESYKTKNMEMISVVEGLEANEKLLKNIIEANTIEIKKSGQSLERLSTELRQLTEAYNDANEQLEQKALHIEEISAILKNKCDTLSEYKAKLDAILPEYEVLKNRVCEQKTIIERHRQEIEMLKTEKEEQLDAVKDKLESEEIKNVGLCKQLNSRNVALVEELNELKQKYEDLQQENAKLERNARNGKIKAESEMEELKETSKTLKSKLEGASNRVAELQEIKNRNLTQLIDIKAMYDLLLRENTEIKKTLSSYETKYNASSSSEHETKLDELLREKNTIALELEYKKLQLIQKEKEVNEYASQVQQLQEKNKELDEELDEYAAIIRNRNVEISELEGKLDSRLTENTRINELQQKLENLNEENEKLRDQVDALNMRLQMDREMTEEDIKSRQNENVIRILKRENYDLQTKLNNSKKQQREAKQGESDANVSLRDASMMSQDQSLDSSKKMPNNFEGAWNRLTELEGEKYEITKALADSRRQYDNLVKENHEVKRILQLYKSQLNQQNLETRDAAKVTDVLHDENKVTRELENPTTELNLKESKLKEYANKMRDLATKNKDLDIELGKSAAIIHERDVEISKLRETLKHLKEENNKLMSEIGELQARSRTNKSFHNDIGESHYRLWNNTSVSNESTRRQLQNSVVEDDDKVKQLKKKLHDLELQLVSKNGRLATLELQIQSQSFPYQRRCKELEEQVLAFLNKNTELSVEIKKLQRTLNDVNAWECDVCRRWRVNRKDQGCQTIPSSTVRFCSSSSGVVEDHIKIEKLEKEKTLMKTLCRTRSRHIKDLEAEIDRLKELIKT